MYEGSVHIGNQTDQITRIMKHDIKTLLMEDKCYKADVVFIINS